MLQGGGESEKCHKLFEWLLMLFLETMSLNFTKGPKISSKKSLFIRMLLYVSRNNATTFHKGGEGGQKPAQETVTYFLNGPLKSHCTLIFKMQQKTKRYKLIIMNL